MSALRDTLRAQLARFDDEAFAALANRGLLRRAYKDLESATPTVDEERDDALLVDVSGQRVRFDARGPAQARCTCPASGVCQHILAAAIGLQRIFAETTPSEARTEAVPAPAAEAVVEPTSEPVKGLTGASAGSPSANAEAGRPEVVAGTGVAPAQDALAELQQALLRIAHADLVKHAGKAGYRWAWQFVQDLEPEKDLRIGGERHLVIVFASPRLTFRYMGGAIDALIADNPPAQIEKYRVAAVLACRRAHGLDLITPEPTAKQRAAELDLGKDHALAASADEALDDSRRRLRVAVAQLLGECVELGLSHLSPAVQQRFSTLAVWAQGAEYYRLALLLRRLADHVELLLERAGGADEHVLFDEIALALALIGALESAAARGVQPMALVGRARSRYEHAGQLELLGLGASAWRSGSGYLGLTLLFWSLTDRAFYSCTDARPEVQRGFDPIARYKAAGPWSGLGAPALATGRSLNLTGAQINAAGRLSAAEGTAAVVREIPVADFVQALSPETDWSQLFQRRREHKRSLLSEPQPMKDWVVVRPARVGAAGFDSARQTLVWPVFDAADEALRIELAYSDYSAHAITRIEQLAAAWPVGTMLVLRLRDGLEGTVAEPLSAIGAGLRADGNPVDALHFDPAPAQGLLSKGAISKWLGKLGRRSPEQAGELQLPPATLPKPLRELQRWLRRQAERGVQRDHASGLHREFDARLTALRNAGLTAFASREDGEASAATLLRLNYLCMQYERLFGADQGESAE